MGFGFPTGMQIVNGIDRRPTPWFWAINRAAGVLASGLAVLVSIEFSISTTLWCGAVPDQATTITAAGLRGDVEGGRLTFEEASWLVRMKN
jgi:hypothetical protein